MTINNKKTGRNKASTAFLNELTDIYANNKAVFPEYLLSSDGTSESRAIKSTSKGKENTYILLFHQSNASTSSYSDQPCDVNDDSTSTQNDNDSASSTNFNQPPPTKKNVASELEK
ncbi:unnamed protein product [Psylliodes chrysocephalus]|uniref:Uncharacterized protein n=1 Tax=Psylliodes chrysocephalus TaxID=3402493 RepID=A0A9P0CVK4_9CUCU|nr:unnamed protein product [Psylliodes chrysocephala]